MSVALSSSAALSVRSLRPRQSVIHASRHVVTLASRFLKRRARQITSSKPDRMLALTISTLAFSGPAARGPARALVRMSDAAPVAPPPPPPPPLAPLPSRARSAVRRAAAPAAISRHACVPSRAFAAEGTGQDTPAHGAQPRVASPSPNTPLRPTPPCPPVPSPSPNTPPPPTLPWPPSSRANARSARFGDAGSRQRGWFVDAGIRTRARAAGRST